MRNGIRPSLLLALGVVLAGATGCGDGPTSLGNHPPQIFRPRWRVYHDTEYRETVVVLDADGDSLDVQATILPSWMTFDPSTRVLSGFPGVNRVGSHHVKIRAEDGTAADTLSFFIQVLLQTSGLIYQGPWIAHGFPFGHDGEPWVGESFIVYSDFSAQEERRYLAETLESDLQDIKASLGVVSNDEFDGWGPETRIDVLSLRAQADTVLWMGNSFRYGFIVHSPDSNRYAEAGYYWSLYNQLLRHELMHVVEYYLTGKEEGYTSVAKWFHEGMAMVMGGNPPGAIRSVSARNQWRAAMATYPGQGNPIAVRIWTDYPEPLRSNAQALNGYYLAFELAVRYLLDPDGLGRSPADVKGLYLSIREGSPFPAAFQKWMGLSVAAYQEEFWTRMEEYLG